MATKKLLDKAKELGLEPVEGEADEALAARINEAQNNQDQETEKENQDEPERTQGFVNTTENLGEGAELPDRPRTRELTDDDREAIVEEFNAPGAQVGAIAAKYDIEGAEVFAIVDEANSAKVSE